MDLSEGSVEGMKVPRDEGPNSASEIEGRLASQEKRIAYLIKKLSRIEARKEVEIEAPSKAGGMERKLGDLKRVLIDNGLEIVGFNENGIIRLKPVNEVGFDTLRKLNTLFHVDVLITYFEQHLK